MPERPNIVWFCTDQQRYDTIGALNNPHIQTPHLDAFMQTATTFNHCYSQSPICTPSRAAFLTSRYPRTCHGRQNGQLEFPQSELLVTQYLADHGYDCGLSGKLHLSACCKVSEKPHRPRDGYRNFWWSHHPQPDWDDEDYTPWATRDGHTWQELWPNKSNPGKVWFPGVPAKYHQTTWCVEKAIEHIEQDHGGGPWLMSLNPFDPHPAFDAPQEYLDRYDLDSLPLPRWRENEWESKSPWQVIDHRGWYGGGGRSVDTMDETHLREMVRSYYAMISLIDDQFGRLVKYLEDTGQREDTIIIFTSDHGEMLGDHGIVMKGPHFYDCCVRVPLIMSWPGHWQEGVVSDAMVELIDLAPTLVEAAELDQPPTFQGCSIGGVLRGEETTHRNDVYAEYHNVMNCHTKSEAGRPYASMLRTRQHKVVVYHGWDGGELYDLEADPGEFENLWHSPAHHGLRDRMVKACFDRVVFTLDPWPPRVAAF